MSKHAAVAQQYTNGSAVPVIGTMDELDNVVRMHPDEDEELSFLQKRLVDLRLKTMQHPPTPPYWNPTMVTAWCAVIGALILILSTIVGLYLYTWERAEKVGDEKGYQRAVIEQMTERLAVQERTAQQAKDLKLAAPNAGPGHSPEERSK